MVVTLLHKLSAYNVAAFHLIMYILFHFLKYLRFICYDMLIEVTSFAATS